MSLPLKPTNILADNPRQYNWAVTKFLKNQLLFLLLNIFLYIYFVASPVQAIVDPLSVPNNKIGIHLLFHSEIEKAAKMVNNDGHGSWGYVTIPIQATERNRDKWQKFFDDCLKLKVIPLVRVATVPNGSNWEKPNNYDLIDFANFLNELKWPTQNRYVIIFNEVNRSDEFGGFVSPENYADILANASDIFKSKSQDFFILPAGLDNAAVNSKTSMAPRRYTERMYLHRTDIFDKIDGWTSHAYPNPGFSAKANEKGINKIDSYRHDLSLIHQFTTKKLPVFITEAGWSNQYLSDYQVSLYYQYALKNVWSDPYIVAITPFLFSAQDGPFTVFSFIDKEGQFKEFAQTFSQEATKGEPILTNQEKQIKIILSSDSTISANLPAEYREEESILNLRSLLKKIANYFGF